MLRRVDSFSVGDKVWYIWRMWDNTFHLASAVLTKEHVEQPVGFIYSKDEKAIKKYYETLAPSKERIGHE